MSTGGATRAAAVSRLAVLAATGLLVAGCTSINAAEQSFEGTGWAVLAVNGQSPPTGGRDHALYFGNGGVIGGSFGCNNIGGQYHVQGSAMSTTGLHSTLIGCPGPLATYEQQGLAVLQQRMRLNWTSDRKLMLSNAAGSIALERLP